MIRFAHHTVSLSRSHVDGLEEKQRKKEGEQSKQCWGFPPSLLSWAYLTLPLSSLSTTSGPRRSAVANWLLPLQLLACLLTCLLCVPARQLTVRAICRSTQAATGFNGAPGGRPIRLLKLVGAQWLGPYWRILKASGWMQRLRRRPAKWPLWGRGKQWG